MAEILQAYVQTIAGEDFYFTAADQGVFQERRLFTPKRCRLAVRQRKTTRGLGYRSGSGTGTPVICSGCGQPTTVPFEPRGDRPYFAGIVYQARKAAAGAAEARADEGR